MSLKSELQSIVENLAESSFGLGTGAESIRGDISADEAVSQILDLLDKSLPGKVVSNGASNEFSVGFDEGYDQALADVRKVIKEGL